MINIIIVLCIIAFGSMLIYEVFFEPQRMLEEYKIEAEIRKTENEDRDKLIEKLTEGKRTFNEKELGHTQEIRREELEFKKDGIEY